MTVGSRGATTGVKLARTSRGVAWGLHVTCVCGRNLFSKLRIGVHGDVPLRFGLEASRKQGKKPGHNTVCAHVSLNMSLLCHAYFSRLHAGAWVDLSTPLAHFGRRSHVRTIAYSAHVQNVRVVAVQDSTEQEE